VAIRYVGIDHSENTETEVVAEYSSLGKYTVYSDDDKVVLDDIDGVEIMEDVFDNVNTLYYATHVGIKNIGEKYDTVIFVLPTEDMNNLKSSWESNKDLPENKKHYSRTWFEPINKRSDL